MGDAALSLDVNAESELTSITNEAKRLLDEIRNVHAECSREASAVSPIHTELSALVEKFRGYLDQINQDSHLVQKTRTSGDSILTEINQLKGQTTAHAAEIKARADQAQQNSTLITDLLQKAQAVETKSEAQAAHLEQLNAKGAQLAERLEGLLPGGASAGLASSYRQQQESWSGPRKFWAGIFLVSMSALFGIAFLNIGDTSHLTPDNALQYLFARLPYLVAPVWLAFYASHKHTIAGRLQEEYRHKETTSMSFEGYKRQLEEIQKGQQADTPVIKLCESVIGTLAVNPSRVFTEKHPDTSPFGTLSALLSRKKDSA